MNTRQTLRFISVALLSLKLGILAYLIKYALKAFLTHHMSPALYGDFAMSLRLLDVIAVIALLGTNVSANKFLSTFIKNERHHQTKDYIKWNIHFISRALLACLVIAGITVFISLSLHHFDFKHISSHHLSIYALWFTPFFAITLLCGNFILCKRATILSYLLSKIAIYALLLMATVGAILYFNMTLDAVNMTWILFGVVTSIFVINFFTTQALIPGFTHYFWKGITSRASHPKWEKTAITLTFNNISFQLLIALDLFILEALAHDEHAVAYFSVAATIARFLYLFPVTLYRQLTPTIAHDIKSQSGKNKLQKKWHKTTALLLFFIVISAAALAYFGRDLLDLFSHEYQNAYHVTLILILDGLVGSAIRPTCSLMAYSGEESLLFKTTMVEVAWMVVGGSILVYFYGVYGIAWGLLVKTIVKAIFLNARCRHKIGFKALIWF